MGLHSSEESQPFYQRKRNPYRMGGFAPQLKECPLTESQCIFGAIPPELADSMYIRNGGNPAADIGDDDAYHWFDSDGMLSGVLFRKTLQGSVRAEFVNRFLLTDVYLASKNSKSRRPILPSVATLLSPISSLHIIVFSILRSVILVICSFFTSNPIKRISVANTAVLFFDGRAVATCESGPPLWVELPSLETVGWWSLEEEHEKGLRERFAGPTSFIHEFTTAHPKRDSKSGELILYHNSFLPPYLKYSVIPSSDTPIEQRKRITAHPVPIESPRMMHDFAVSRKHTVIVKCPLSLDPLNLARGKPVVNYSPTTPTSFGIFERHSPEKVRWYDSESCCIFHTANAWSDPIGVNVLCCRMNSSALVYAAGNLPVPLSQLAHEVEDTCQLHYYSFPLSSDSPQKPTFSFPLSSIPFEFPEVSSSTFMEEARYVYGCSLTNGRFTTALGRASKIDCLVKMDVLSLIAKGKSALQPYCAPADTRSVIEILSTQVERASTTLENEPIRIFSFPEGFYGQEASFVSREFPRGEDDGFLLCYVFDESQLDREGKAKEDARSELWVVDAWNMVDVVARILLPQRVPYGLHGEWFSKEDINSQRPIPALRERPTAKRSASWTKRNQSLGMDIIEKIQMYLD